MRTLSLALQQVIASRHGIEPIMIIGINWGFNGELMYGDKELLDQYPGILPKIIELPEMETTTILSGNSTVTNFSITLDDTDGTIKNILDLIDVHFNPINVYQYFPQVPLSDAVLMYEGVIATPIEWNEGDRTVTLSAQTRLLNQLVGFSLDESDLPVFHQDLLNKAWPMCFGNPIHVPALQLQQVPSGYILKAFGVPDPSIPYRLALLGQKMAALYSPIYNTASSDENWNSSDEDLQTALAAARSALEQRVQQLQQMGAELSALTGTYQQQLQWALPRNMVEGGLLFPQNVTIKCKINEQLFLAKFLGTGNETYPEAPVPVDLTPVYYNWTGIDTAAQLVDQATNLSIVSQTVLPEGFTLIQAGSKIELIDLMPGGFNYVASITPGTVQAVYAFRSYNGSRRLTQVPQEYYSIKHSQLSNALPVTMINLPRQLSSISYFANLKTTTYDDYISRLSSTTNIAVPLHLIAQEDWENDLYVTFQSSIGPNAVDVMIWLIETFSNFTYDLTTFNSVRDDLAQFPVAFAVMDRPLISDILADIAYQSRCALFIKNNKYYLKYLPGDPDIVDTITESDIKAQSYKITVTPTEELITQYLATFQTDYVMPQNTIALRNNVDKYGIVSETHNYYIYNIVDLVLKSATFWLIRKSMTWKYIECSVFLDHLGIEALDDINLVSAKVTSNLDNTVACQVDSCNYDSENNVIVLKLWTGIRLGEMTTYPFSRPQNVSENLIYPLYYDITSGGGAGLNPGYTPVIPPYTGAQVSVEDDGEGPGTGPLDVSMTPLGYITNTTGRPFSAGDPRPSDLGHTYTGPTYSPSSIATREDPNFNYTYPDYPDIPVPPDNSTTVFPAQIVSGSGSSWQLSGYPNGLSNASINITATETHQDSHLAGLANEWTVVVGNTDPSTGNITYTFTWNMNAAFPVVTSGSGSGSTAYPQGPNGSSMSVNVVQLQMDGSASIPTGTSAIAVRMWDPTNGINYAMQVPVWLPYLPASAELEVNPPPGEDGGGLNPPE